EAPPNMLCAVLICAAPATVGVRPWPEVSVKTVEPLGPSPCSASETLDAVGSPGLSDAVPICAVPSMKVTVPEGLEPDTTAVKAAPWLTMAGLGPAASLVVVPTGPLTATVIAADVLAALALSPP